MNLKKTTQRKLYFDEEMLNGYLKCYLTLNDLFPELILNASLSFPGSLPTFFKSNF